MCSKFLPPITPMTQSLCSPCSSSNFCFILHVIFSTASIFEISGITLVSVGAGLTVLGIVACFHSCCVVLCYRPANKPGKPSKSGSQKSNASSEKSAPISTLPINYQINRNGANDLMLKQQQQPLLVNGGLQPVPSSVSASPPPPQRSATSPKFFPAVDDVAPLWSQLRDSDKRRHQSQGNVRQQPYEQVRSRSL